MKCELLDKSSTMFRHTPHSHTHPRIHNTKKQVTLFCRKNEKQRSKTKLSTKDEKGKKEMRNEEAKIERKTTQMENIISIFCIAFVKEETFRQRRTP